MLTVKGTDSAQFTARETAQRCCVEVAVRTTH
jgi:hypothetical protein